MLKRNNKTYQHIEGIVGGVGDAGGAGVDTMAFCIGNRVPNDTVHIEQHNVWAGSWCPSCS